MTDTARAIAIGLDSNHIEGAHHLRWVIDQMLRALLGDDYWRAVAEVEIERWPNEWDEGIAP